MCLAGRSKYVSLDHLQRFSLRLPPSKHCSRQNIPNTLATTMASDLGSVHGSRRRCLHYATTSLTRGSRLYVFQPWFPFSSAERTVDAGIEPFSLGKENVVDTPVMHVVAQGLLQPDMSDYQQDDLRLRKYRP